MVCTTMRNARGWGKGGLFFLAVILFFSLSGIVFAYSLVKSLPSPESLTQRAIVESTKIYDRTGKVLLYEIHGEEKRTIIPLSEIPSSVKMASIAAEDLHFYEHGGLDWRGIFRAFAINLVRGDITQGGSTITQQLIKNSILTSERTFSRKLKEALLAVLVEKTYSKDEILNLYLNQIPYGSNAYGIAAASQTFFAKPVQDLTLAEAALLSALPKAPTYYSPYGSHKSELLARRNWILDRMAEKKFADGEAVEKGKNTPLDLAPPKQAIRAPHFVFYVKEYLNNKYGEEFVEQGGLRVITTLDWSLQKEAENLVKDGAEQNEKLVQAYNASLVSIDPKSGEILAMVGSRDYWESPLPEGCSPGVNCRFDPHVNIAIRERQPGSAFKPFVYATAFQKGYTPDTVLFDVSTEFNPGCNPDGTPGTNISDPKDCYHPQDYDGKFRGPVSLRQAIAQSLNVPSVKLLYLAGIQDSINTAKDLGISTLKDPERYGLTLVLGGAEVKLLEMASAFGVFAQDGILHPATSILRVENAQGTLLEEKKEVSVPALDTNIARSINEVLSDNEARVPVFSPQSSLYFPNRRVAAKTGTTQDYRDAWVIGYTPSLVTGVWVGNNDNAPMKQGGVSIMVAGPIWHKFMDSALSKIPPEDFAPPDIGTPDKPVMRGVYRAGPVVRVDKISKKLATEFTPPELIEEQSFGEVRSILAFIDKSNPLGDPPSSPLDDPQFRNWDSGIKAWLAGNHLLSPDTPGEYDNIHTPAKKPAIQIISPLEISGPAREIRTRIKSTFPLREAILFVNDEIKDSKAAPILSDLITFSFNELGVGDYKIKITAYDAVGNRESITQSLVVK